VRRKAFHESLVANRVKERIQSYRKIESNDGSNVWGGYSKAKVKSSK
jgi:hypothetical protein